jgi:hypothetical protein
MMLGPYLLAHFATAAGPLRRPLGPFGSFNGVPHMSSRALVAEEPHRSTILNLEHFPLKANVSCLIFPLHQGKMSSAWPLSGLDSPSKESRGQLTSIASYHSPPSLSPFTTGKATRAHLARATFSPYLLEPSRTIEPAVVRHQSPLS